MGLSTALERRASPENPSTNLARPAEWLFEALGGEKTPSGVAVNEEKSLRNSAVLACNRVLSETLASLPLPVYRRDGSSRERATDHPAYQLLHDRPNPELSSYHFREILQMHLGMWGNAYAEKELSGGGELMNLWPLTPSRVTPRRESGAKLYDVDLPDGSEITLPAGKVLHIPGLGYDGLKGFSPIAMARRAVALGLAAEEHGSRFYGQGATVAGTLEHPDTLTEKAQQRLRRSMESTYSGLSNAHRVMILEEGMQYNAIGIPPEQAQFLQTRKFQATEIARIYRVPPHMIADTDRPFQSNVEQMSLQFVKFTMAPWLQRWEQVLNWEVFTASERADLFAEFLVDGLLRGDSQARGELYRALFGVAGIAPNEIARRENLPEVEGGDERFVPLNMVPLSQARQMAEEDMRLAQGDAESRDATVTKAFRERRAMRTRRRLRRAHEPLIRQAAQRIVRREVSSARAALEGAFGERDAADFEAWMDEFYATHGDYVTDQMRPVLETYAEAVWVEAVEEAGGEDEDLTPEAREFMSSYLAVLAQRYVGSSEGQLRALLRDNPPNEAAEAIGQRLDEWEEKRPDKVASNESVRFEGALARFAWDGMGVTKLVWRTGGTDDCPLCEELDGRVVGIERPFVAKGETVEGDDDDTAPLTSRSDVNGPPLHQGCDCSISPA